MATGHTDLVLRRVASCLAPIILAGCGPAPKPPPDGALGARWGEDADAVASRLGVACTWERDPADPTRFERCSSERRAEDGIEVLPGEVEAYGLVGQVYVRLEGGGLVGVRWWGPCAQWQWLALRDAVADDYGLRVQLRYPNAIGLWWDPPAYVHAAFDGERRCSFAAANAAYGEASRDASLREGVARFVGMAQPH